MSTELPGQHPGAVPELSLDFHPGAVPELSLDLGQHPGAVPELSLDFYSFGGSESWRSF